MIWPLIARLLAEGVEVVAGEAAAAGEATLARELVKDIAKEALSSSGGASGAPHRLNYHFENLDGVIGRLDSMMDRLDQFPIDMLNETQAWEREDVHRRNPQAQQSLDGVEVIFRTHVSGIVKLRRSYAARRDRLLARRAFYGGLNPAPVVRQALIDQLLARLDRLMANTLAW